MTEPSEDSFAAHRRRDTASGRDEGLSRRRGPRRRAGGWGAISLCLGVACQGLVNYERSPAEPGSDAGGEVRADAEGPAPSGSISGADAGSTVPAPEPGLEPAPEPGVEPTSVSEPVALMGPVGSACTEDVDCSQAQPFPLVCVTSQSDAFPGILVDGITEPALGGPPGGYCSRTCMVDGECGANGARCLDHPGLGRFCYAACSLTEATVQCVGGGPQACVFVSNPDGGACYPLCRSHEQCGPGRFCNATNGLCVAEVRDTGGGVGAPCSLDTEAIDCRSGICLDETGTGSGICTALCRGGDTECGAAAGEPARGSVCLSEDQSPGAAGWCLPLCDTDADCERSDYVCQVGSPVAGRQGVCAPPSVPGSDSSGSGSVPPEAP